MSAATTTLPQMLKETLPATQAKHMIWNGFSVYMLYGEVKKYPHFKFWSCTVILPGCWKRGAHVGKSYAGWYSPATPLHIKGSYAHLCDVMLRVMRERRFGSRSKRACLDLLGFT